jgi:hypothetical protein
MVNVVVAFMVLGYPVIGQGGTCGTSFNTFDPPETLSPPTKSVCTAHGKSDAQEKAFMLLKGELFKQCKDPCSQQCNNVNQICVKTKINKINSITIDSTAPSKLMTCVPNGKCSDETVNYDCSITFATVECDCNCCSRTRSKLRSETCEIGEDCNICDGDLVDLDEFTATPQSNGISLTWTTKSELDSQGFRIWRGTPDLGKYCGCSDNMDDYKQITITTLDEAGNPTLIPATGSTTSGSQYSYLDKEVKPGIPYCYALEDIDSKGESKFYFEYISFTPDAELEKGTPE